MKIDINKPIPSNLSVVGWKEVKIQENNEPLVSLNDFAPEYIQVKSQYFEQNIKGALEICYCRKGVAQKLIEAAKYLPKGYKFLIWDAWRTVEVQQSIFNNFKVELKLKHPKLIDDYQLQKATEKYVSLPSSDPLKPSPHLTGGAIDLTIVNDEQVRLEMGTEFDFFGKTAKTDFFETNSKTDNDFIVRDNRRLLYNILINCGFTNYPEEWWHFDFGNQFWALSKKTTAIYNFAKKQKHEH